MTRRRNRSPQTLAALEALLRRPDDWRHGYALSRETGLSSGTLYPLLIRLFDQGLLDARWEEGEREGAPRRHAYRLTSEGREFAADVLRDSASQPRGLAARRAGGAPA